MQNPLAYGHKPAIRRLWPAEGHRYLDHLLRLSAHDRYMRFSGNIGDANLQRYGTRALSEDGSAFVGCFVEGELRAVGELRVAGEFNGRRLAEVAFSVEGPFQGRGIGSALMERLIVHARNRLLHELMVLTLPQNRRMRALARRYGFELESGSEEVEGRRVLPGADPWSWCGELLAEAMGLWQSPPELAPTPALERAA